MNRITDAHIQRVIAQTLAVSHHLAAIDRGLPLMGIRTHVNYEFEPQVILSRTEEAVPLRDITEDY